MDLPGRNLGVRSLLKYTPLPPPPKKKNRGKWWGAFRKSKVISSEAFQNKYLPAKEKKNAFTHGSYPAELGVYQIHFQSIAIILNSHCNIFQHFWAPTLCQDLHYVLESQAHICAFTELIWECGGKDISQKSLSIVVWSYMASKCPQSPQISSHKICTWFSSCLGGGQTPSKGHYYFASSQFIEEFKKLISFTLLQYQIKVSILEIFLLLWTFTLHFVLCTPMGYHFPISHFCVSIMFAILRIQQLIFPNACIYPKFAAKSFFLNTISCLYLHSVSALTWLLIIS